MKNADMPAMPLNSSIDTMEDKEYSTAGGRFIEANGLTKREMFAMNAMQGALSNSGANVLNSKELAKIAVKLADALLAELEK